MLSPLMQNFLVVVAFAGIVLALIVWIWAVNRTGDLERRGEYTAKDFESRLYDLERRHGKWTTAHYSLYNENSAGGTGLPLLSSGTMEYSSFSGCLSADEHQDWRRELTRLGIIRTVPIQPGRVERGPLFWSDRENVKDSRPTVKPPAGHAVPRGGAFADYSEPRATTAATLTGEPAEEEKVDEAG